MLQNQRRALWEDLTQYGSCGRLSAMTGLLALSSARIASATEISRSGDVMTLSGRIDRGDGYEFERALQEAAAAPPKFLYLNSGGGDISSAEKIAQIVRNHSMTTVVDASRAKCASACTLIFVAGTNRVYLHAEDLSEGAMSKSGFRGLGFHQGRSSRVSPLNSAVGVYSSQATATMNAIYRQMGVPEASELLDKSPPSKYYRISSKTALSMGIATSTALR